MGGDALKRKLRSARGKLSGILESEAGEGEGEIKKRGFPKISSPGKIRCFRSYKNHLGTKANKR